MTTAKGAALRAYALRTDGAAIEAILGPLPTEVASLVREQLAHIPRAFRGMHYDQATRRGIWVAADPYWLQCVTLPDLTSEQAAEIYTHVARSPLSATATMNIAAAYARITGVSIELFPPRADT